MESTSTSRHLAFVVGWTYLSLHTLLISAATEASLFVVFLGVVAASGVILAVIGFYCVRFARRDRAAPRFGTASVLLAFVPISIYCGIIRWFAQDAIANEASSPSPFPWITFLAICVVWMTLTTGVLLWFGDAIVWISLKLVAKSHK
jgi:hypothetical protein